MTRNLVFAVVSLALLIAQAGAESSGERVDAATLLAAPETLEVEGFVLTMSTLVWRSIDGAVAGVLIVECDGSDIFPQGMWPNAAWLLKSGRIVATIQLETQRLPSGLQRPTRLIRVFNAGPILESGARVDVVVRFIDGKGRAYHLRTTDQYVGSSNARTIAG